jgi:hypothetical protein
MKALIKSKKTHCLMLMVNLVIACLPFWDAGAMVICDCGVGHITIELKDSQNCMACCNDCNRENNNIEQEHITCLCRGIPISKNFSEFATCYARAEGYEKASTYCGYCISQSTEPQHQQLHYHLTHYHVPDKNILDVLRITILII